MFVKQILNKYNKYDFYVSNDCYDHIGIMMSALKQVNAGLNEKSREVKDAIAFNDPGPGHVNVPMQSKS